MSLTFAQQAECITWVRYTLRDYREVLVRLDEAASLYANYGPDVATFLADVVTVAQWQVQHDQIAAAVAWLEQALGDAEGDGLAALLET